MSQLAYVDGGRSQREGGEASSSAEENAEEAIEIKGSYGTKVCYKGLYTAHFKHHLLCTAITVHKNGDGQ